MSEVYFPCGCELLPQSSHERCVLHRNFTCHGGILGAGLECPPCYRSRLLSVSISPAATPSRKRPAADG